MDELGFPIEAEYFEKSNEFMPPGEPLTVCVWVESADDIRFWQPLLKKNEKYSFEFKYGSLFLGADQKTANGCSRLIKLVKTKELTLGKAQILCLDSDFRHIVSLHPECDSLLEAESEKHIYWTRAHSKENIHISPRLITEALCHICPIQEEKLEQPPREIFETFSSDIFTAFSKIVFLKAKHWNQENSELDGFTKLMEQAVNNLCLIEKTGRIVFSENNAWARFREALSELDNKINNHLAANNLKEAYEEFLGRIKNNDINQKNIILFYRGHDIYRIMIRIFKSVISYYKTEAMSKISKTAKTKEIASQQIQEFHSGEIKLEDCIKSRNTIYGETPFFIETEIALRTEYSA